MADNVTAGTQAEGFDRSPGFVSTEQKNNNPRTHTQKKRKNIHHNTLFLSEVSCSRYIQSCNHHKQSNE
mgnify:CR=1 FL=1